MIAPSESRQPLGPGHASGSWPGLYDVLANIFFLGRRGASFRALIEATGVKPGYRVLDVGCGTGYFTRLIANAVGTEGSVVGVDPSAATIDYAARKSARTLNCAFRVGSVEELDFADDHFDAVVSSLMLHHLPRRLQFPALREMSRVLKPRGTLLVADAKIPDSHFSAARVLTTISRHHGMAKNVPPLDLVVDAAGFAEVRAGVAPPLLQYVVAVKPVRVAPDDGGIRHA